MRVELERKLRRVRVRLLCGLLLETTAWTLALAGVLAVVAVVAERMLAVGLPAVPMAWALAGGWALLTAGLWWLRRPGHLQTAILADERMGFSERFSTAMAVAGSDDPFAVSVVAEARRAAQRLDVKGQFPVRPSRAWYLAVAPWAVFVGLLVFLPNMDLLSRLAQRRQRQRQTAQLDQAKAQIKQASAVVKSAVDKLGDQELAAELKTLGELTRSAKPVQLRTQAIRKLSDLSEKIKQMREGEKYRAAARIKQMMKKLRSFPKSRYPQLQRALAQGRFDKAAEAVKDLQRQLDEGKMTDAEKKALQRELDDLAKQLDKLGDQRKAAEDALEEAGQDKRLAQLSDDDIRKALRDKGLTREQIDRLMRELQDCRAGSEACEQLAEALSECGTGRQLSAEEFDGVLDQLSDMESMTGRLADVEETLEQIEAAIAQLGQCQGQGEGEGGKGGRGLFLEGDSARRGPGTGGPGKGYGEQDTAAGGNVGTRKTRARGKTQKGPIIASRFFRGPQVKGAARQELTEVVQAAADIASEAISDKRIPRKYESSVKDYFGELEEAGRQE